MSLITENKNAEPETDDGAPPEDPQVSAIQDFFLFLKENKKWWLIPMLLIVFGLGGILLLGTGPLAPFIYPLF